METLHRNALRVLAEVGMEISYDEALDHLDAFGCTVDRESQRVFFSLKRSFRSAWISCVGTSRRVRRLNVCRCAIRMCVFVLSRSAFIRTSPSTRAGIVFLTYDMNGVRRRGDVAGYARCVEGWRISWIRLRIAGLPVAAQDVPLAIRPIRMAAELVKTTDKIGGIEALTPFDIEYICRIGEVVQGGSDHYHRRPILIGYAEARTPLCIDGNMAQVMLEYIKRGLPQSLDTMPNAGATGPDAPRGHVGAGAGRNAGRIGAGVFSGSERGDHT